jgi:hypothetical protein
LRWSLAFKVEVVSLSVASSVLVGGDPITFGKHRMVNKTVSWRLK